MTVVWRYTLWPTTKICSYFHLLILTGTCFFTHYRPESSVHHLPRSHCQHDGLHIFRHHLFCNDDHSGTGQHSASTHTHTHTQFYYCYKICSCKMSVCVCVSSLEVWKPSSQPSWTSTQTFCPTEERCSCWVWWPYAFLALWALLLKWVLNRAYSPRSLFVGWN